MSQPDETNVEPKRCEPKSVKVGGVEWPRQPPEFQFLGTTPWTAITDIARLTALEAIMPAELGGWVERLQRAGVTADRQNSPDLLGQMAQSLRRPVDTVLCSVLDVDPYACVNSAIAARYAIEMTAGLLVVGRLTHARRAAVIIDSRVPATWFPLLRKACTDRGIRVEPIINDYPQADPTLMLYALLGRRLRPTRLPTERGAFLLDAAAAVAIGRYALLDESMQQVPLAVHDHLARRCAYAVIPMGLSVAELLGQLEMDLDRRVLRSGDLLRDLRVDASTKIGAGELVFHSTVAPAPVNPSPCIRCGWCIDGCPTRVQPATVLEASQRGDVDMAEQAGVEACIECGVCSYVCPSNLPLLTAIRSIRKTQHAAASQSTAATSDNL